MGDAEAIVICIDNSKAAVFYSNSYDVQLEAIKLYCTAKLDANSESEVALFLMAAPKPRYLLTPPTSDLQEILNCVPSSHYDTRELRFENAAWFARFAFHYSSPSKKKRMLFFAGSPTDLTSTGAEICGKNLKDLGIAVDVVSIDLKEDPKCIGNNRFGRVELDEFVTAANHGNSKIVHLNPGDSVRDVLSETILEETLRHLRMKNNHKKATGTADNKHVPNLYRFETLSLENVSVK